MEYEKKKMHPFFKILIILFIIFIGFYIALQSGYYPSRIKKKTIYTNESIGMFEESIKNGEELKKDGYLEEEIDYSNFLTKAGNGLTHELGKFITGSISGVGKTLKFLFW